MLLCDSSLPKIAALDAKAGFLLELCVAVCIDQLDGGWALPGDAVGVRLRVNARAGVEEI